MALGFYNRETLSLFSFEENIPTYSVGILKNIYIPMIFSSQRSMQLCFSVLIPLIRLPVQNRIVYTPGLSLLIYPDLRDKTI